MNGMIIFPTDKRKEAAGFYVGQRVKLKIGRGAVGSIVGFGPAMHKGATVKIALDDELGNMGDHHSCGSGWIEAT